MGKPDALSHWLDHANGSSDDEESVLLNPHMFRTFDRATSILEKFKDNLSLMDLAMMEQLGKSDDLDLQMGEAGYIWKGKPSWTHHCFT